MKRLNFRNFMALGFGFWALACAGHNAYAEPASNDFSASKTSTVASLLKNCEQEIEDDKTFPASPCSNYVQGYMDGIHGIMLELLIKISKLDADSQNKILTPPQKSLFCADLAKPKDLARAFIKWAHGNQDKFKMGASFGMMASMKENFPCNETLKGPDHTMKKSGD